VTENLALLNRLDAGRPLVLGGDAAAGLAAMGLHVADASEIGALVRDHADAVVAHYHHEIGAGVDVLCALTAETMPRALHRLGMAFRAAALTGTAVDLALDAADEAPHPLLVAGVLGSRALAPVAADRMGEELAMHAARLSAAGCELLLARGFERGVGRAGAGDDETGPHSRLVEPQLARLARRAAIISASATGLPTWAIISATAEGTIDGESFADAVDVARNAGASALIFELYPPVDAEPLLAKLLRAAEGLPLGVGLAAAGSASSFEGWASAAKALIDAGARIVAGGPGTTPHHLAALGALLRQNDRPSFFPRAI
jgi:S-methylmethionine-dependent homocysteine/selenocysteine methylase